MGNNNNTNMTQKGEDPGGRIYCCVMVDRDDPHPHSKALRDAPGVHVKNENPNMEPTLIRLDGQQSVPEESVNASFRGSSAITQHQPTYQPAGSLRQDSPLVITTDTPAKEEEDAPREIITASARKGKRCTLAGVSLESRGGVICVKGLSIDSIFRKTALKEGLEIVAINSVSTTGKTLQEVANLIYETEGTLVIQAKEINRAPFTVTVNKERKNSITGLKLDSLGSAIFVKEILPNSIFQGSGLLEGHEIITVNGVAMENKTVPEAVALIRESEGQLEVQARLMEHSTKSSADYWAVGLYPPGAPSGGVWGEQEYRTSPGTNEDSYLMKFSSLFFGDLPGMLANSAAPPIETEVRQVYKVNGQIYSAEGKLLPSPSSQKSTARLEKKIVCCLPELICCCIDFFSG